MGEPELQPPSLITHSATGDRIQMLGQRQCTYSFHDAPAKAPVPYAAQPAVGKELDRLESIGVISKFNYSDWAAPIVIVKKSNGSLCICADFSTGLNDALDPHHYPLPLPEDIFATLNGGRCLTHIDIADAYLQIKVDDQSRQLLTINTHRGLYRYNRLPFGVKTPATFQQIMDATLADLQGVVAYQDNVIAVGRSLEEHHRNLNAVFKRISDKNGRRPDPPKIDEIQRMPAPKDVAQLRSFLRLLSYYGNFVKEMHILRAPLDALLTKDAKFEWTKACNDTFNRAMQILASDLLLAHYDPWQEIVVAIDASNYGIGISLTSTSRRNYSQIEKDGHALVYAVQKFHKMLHEKE
ncbi:hypothetical protein ANCCEY_14045 [Ancylostoma ceylanicum]|uniref:RNA-directed DNA polymerase n=1 Tax=Ancylostoma ceylanicum TaxID=53326 RepID=A0A0D6L5S7_9BILA|nr:hypothetical protein ANCCEY_14045 [Ancylostoma ceylanicum]